jgi:hypothetical protein
LQLQPVGCNASIPRRILTFCLWMPCRLVDLEERPPATPMVAFFVTPIIEDHDKFGMFSIATSGHEYRYRTDEISGRSHSLLWWVVEA